MDLARMNLITQAVDGPAPTLASRSSMPEWAFRKVSQSALLEPVAGMMTLSARFGQNRQWVYSLWPSDNEVRS